MTHPISNVHPDQDQSRSVHYRDETTTGDLSSVADVISIDQSPLKLFKKLLEEELAGVNVLILKELESDIDLIPKLATHLVASGGKRVRPLLTLAAAKIVGVTDSRAIALAGAVEFIHTATLLHDDVVDQSDLRRGHPTAHSIWGNSASVLVGDFLFSRAFQLMVQTGDIEILRVLSNASGRITEGEVMQLIDIGNLDTTQERYEQVIERKTAALFEAACRAGAMLGIKDNTVLDHFSNFGKYFGVTFQIVDDVLDYKSDPEAFGKNMGNDLKERKVTLPVLIAYTRGTALEKDFWKSLFKSDNPSVLESMNAPQEEPSQESLNHAHHLILKYKGFQVAFDVAKKYATKSLEELSQIRRNIKKNQGYELLDALEKITRYSLSRTA